MSDNAARDALRRVHVDVAGTVQGVGFRPFVFRHATSLGLSGFVRNESTGVEIELQGSPESIDRFLGTLVDHAPHHARITDVAVDELVPRLDVGSFAIVSSRAEGHASATLPPDLCTCGACLRELFDTANRRYRYPFINCTACGPRFTIARALPYDRAMTTMASFAMCALCQGEHDDPASRRFHAQPNACAVCGPRVSLISRDGAPVSISDHDDSVAAAARALSEGAIVAIKGLGGYHLACRADDPEVVVRLRARKHRDDKPFAVMVRGVRRARALVALSTYESRLLRSSARPIVLLEAHTRSTLAPQVAPGRIELGLMLPYSPLHHLLVASVEAPLVMTSGNRNDEPIAYRDDDALDRLGPIADLFLVHDRPIHARCEDSVVRVMDVAGRRQTLFVRRSRGYVPAPLPLPFSATSSVLAVGGHLKNTACVARDKQALVGAHNGDLGEATAFSAWLNGLEQLTQLSDTTPQIVAYDQHPEYASTAYALERRDLTLVPVQHHHAHLAACLAEHHHRGPAIGLVFDGGGFGNDGTIWGGELLVGDLGAFERLGHLRPVRMPGGDRATIEPWRMACSWLTDAVGAPPPLCTSLEGIIGDSEWLRVSHLSRSTLSPVTTSVGRLLDACAALCGIRARVTYEGQAAIDLEAVADSRDDGAYSISVLDDGDTIILDPRDMVLAVARETTLHIAPASIASRIHRGLVYAAALGAQAARERTGVRAVVLSGGVFQNRLLLEALSTSLSRDGFRVLVPRRLPLNDGGLSFGQVAVAAWRRRSDVSGDSGTGC